MPASRCARSNRAGETYEFDAEGLLSVCVQHEMDHLMGKVFVEYLSPLKRDRIKTKMLKKTRDEAQRLSGPMRVVFAGTPEFAAVALAAAARGRLRDPAGADPARPPGRAWHEAAAVAGEGLRAGAWHRRWRSRAACGWTASIADDAAAAREALLAARPDVMVVAAYGLILPQWVLDLPRLGCLNIHASLLPRWRGAAPSTAPSRPATRETGITIMQMDAGLDTGDMLLVERVPIAADDTTAHAARPPGGAGRAADRRGAGTGRLRWPEAARRSRPTA